MQSEILFLKNKPDGLAKWFYDNGAIEKEGTYKEGNIHGLFRWFNQDGTLSKGGNYINGVLTS